MNTKLFLQAGVFAALLSVAGVASAVTVDFTDAAPLNYNPVPQTYGDSAAANLSYRTLTGGDNWGLGATQLSADAAYWDDPQYSGDQAIFAAFNGNKLEVRLDAAPGLAFSSVGFQLGSYPNTDSADTSYRIYDGAGTELASSTAVPISGTTGLFVALSSLNPGVSTIVFQMGDNWNRGLTSLSYETAPVPLPGALLLLGSGLAGLAGIGRRRRKTVAG